MSRGPGPLSGECDCVWLCVVCASLSPSGRIYLKEDPGSCRTQEDFCMSVCSGMGGSGARPQAGANTCLCVPQSVNVCLCDSVLEDSNSCGQCQAVCVHARAGVVL